MDDRALHLKSSVPVKQEKSRSKCSSEAAESSSAVVHSDLTVLYVREPDGTLHPTTAADYIQELLRHRDLSPDAPQQPDWADLTPERREALIRQTAQQHDILQSSGAVKPTGNSDDNDNDNDNKAE